MLSEKGLHAQRVRVGSVEIDGIQLLASPPQEAGDAEEDGGETHASIAEEEERLRREFERTQYGHTDGV